MVKINNKIVNTGQFPDGTTLVKLEDSDGVLEHKINMGEKVTITWNYESDDETIKIYYITRSLQQHGCKDIVLQMPYIPNARQDRVKHFEDVFTLKYFSEIINSLNFSSVKVLDAHSDVSLGLINNVINISPGLYVQKAISDIKEEIKGSLMMFYPDSGASKRYSRMFDYKYCFGLKQRNWEDGKIKSLKVLTDDSDLDDVKELIYANNVLIVDDISSYGGTFLLSANELKKLGAKTVYLYVSHCEKSILKGDLYKEDDIVNRIYTTDSIFKEEWLKDSLHPDKIKVIKLEW